MSMYADFDKTVKFAEKAGFSLSKIQIEDVEQFVHWSRSLNTYEVGGGKTVVSTVVSMMRPANVEVTVVTVPPILLRAWTKWLRKVSERVVVMSGNPAERKHLDLTTARWIVCSHAIFRKDYAVIERATFGRVAELIVDEAHWLKNPKSVLFLKTQLFVAGNRFLQLLTGTPVSKPLDPYAYIKLKTPTAYRNMTHFEAIHVEERDFWKAPCKFMNLDIMRAHLAVQTISRTKQETHGYNLKPIFPDTEYELAPAHYALYQKLVDERLLEFDDGSVIDAASAQRLRHALQQLIVNYDYFSNNPENRSTAFDVIDQTLEETECSKVNRSKLIIWTKYRRSTESIRDYINGRGIKTVAAYGDGNSAKSIDLFMEEDKTRVGVFQYQSANAGLNPQGVCNEALYIEGDTVSLYMRQSLGRLDRMGQTKVPNFRLAIAANTVQVGIFASLLSNDDTVATIEPTKKSIRAMLLGREA